MRIETRPRVLTEITAGTLKQMLQALPDNMVLVVDLMALIKKKEDACERKKT